MAGITPYLPSARVADKTLSEMDKWFSGKAKQAHYQVGKETTHWVSLLLPPEPGTRDEFLYKVGYLWGCFKSAADLLDLISMVGDALSFALKISETEDIWALIKEAAHELIVPFLPKNLAGLSPFDRGKMAGILLFNLMLLLVVVISAVQAGKKLIGSIPQTVARLAKRAKTAKITVIAAVEMQRRLPSYGFTLEDYKNLLKREIGVTPVVVPRRLFLNLSEKYCQEFYQRAQQGIVRNNKGRIPTMVSVAVDVTTGNVYYGMSDGIDLNNIHPFMRERARFTSETGWPTVENCAEFDSVNNALLGARGRGKTLV